ncbi:MAG: RNA-binding S4 domain-containing protein [Maricaulaceae bacterium]
MDIWLFRARIFKTRTLASQTIRKGRVRITRGTISERVSKPHKKIRSGDILTLMRNRQLINIVVLSAPNRRGPASEAQTHYKIYEPEPA